MMAHDRIRAMIDSGYCRTSWKHRMVSRIDRYDWKKVCSHSADYYRRVLSKDIEIVSHADIKVFPASMMGPEDFKPMAF